MSINCTYSCKGATYPHVLCDIPRSRDPRWHVQLGRLVATFWPSCCPSFFIDFSMPFLIDLGSIFPPNLPPETHQIDAKRRFILSFNFWIIFNWFLVLTSTPKLEQSMRIKLFFNTLREIGLSMLTSIFDSILVPSCLHFPTGYQSKLNRNWNLEGIDF